MKKTNIYTWLLEIFYALTGAIGLLVVLEVIKPLSVLTYFNLNYLMLLWIVDLIAIIILKLRS